MDLSSSVPVVTGAGRGLGRALVDDLLERGAVKVYALARDRGNVRDDRRVIPVRFDLLDPASIAAAAEQAPDATLLINNASTIAFGNLLEADGEAEMVANYRGTYATVRAFVPVIESQGGGQIVNILSLMSLASTPALAGYAASKAAAYSLTQALRIALVPRGITVHAVFPGAIDTEMLAGVDTPKSPAVEVAAAILDALEEGDEDIYPDPQGRAMAEMWLRDPKSLERLFANS